MSLVHHIYRMASLSVEKAVPEKFWSFFRFKEFNELQSLIIDECLHTSENIVVAAPTGSGKTAIHELCILNLLMKTSAFCFKVVLLAPSKALCQQRCIDWQSRFSSFGMRVTELTGDIDNGNCLSEIERSSIVVATPEKWDSVTRTWRESLFLLGAIDLLLIDEAHMLGEDRGAALEMVVVRMRILRDAYITAMARDCESNAEPVSRMRIVSISAVFPNLDDIADWLECRSNHCHYFSEDYRPVPLKTHILTYGTAKNYFLFDKSLDSHVASVIRRFSEAKQTLIFCSSKSSTESLSQRLSDELSFGNPYFKHLDEITRKLEDKKEREYILKGRCAYHHAALPPNDRAIIEELFALGFIRVLCATSTLSQGVNLPAHLVIIKGTNSWRGGSLGFERTKKCDIIQMLGRAGRPGYDSCGIGVIMTSNENSAEFLGPQLEADIVESHLLPNITEAICAEISQNVINTIDEALTWLTKTYLYTRIVKNPKYYGILALPVTEIRTTLTNLLLKSIQNLSASGIIAFNPVDSSVAPLQEARTMTRFMIKFKTMINICRLNNHCTQLDLLHFLSECEETFKLLRRPEKQILNCSLNLNLKYKLQVKVSKPADKAFILLQSAISNLPINDFSLRIDQSDIVEKSLRLLAAVKELCIAKGNGQLLLNAIRLDRCIRCRLWDDLTSSNSLLQCPGLSSNQVVLSLIRMRVCDFSGFYFKTAQELQLSTHCSKADAEAMFNFCSIANASRLSIAPEIRDANLYLKIFSNSISTMADHLAECIRFQLVCYEKFSGNLLCYRDIPRDAKYVVYQVPINSKLSYFDIECHLICTIIGLDFSLNDTEDKNVKVVESVNANDKRLKPTKKALKKDPKISKKSKSHNKKEEFGYFTIDKDSILDSNTKNMSSPVHHFVSNTSSSLISPSFTILRRKESLDTEKNRMLDFSQFCFDSNNNNLSETACYKVTPDIEENGNRKMNRLMSQEATTVSSCLVDNFFFDSDDFINNLTPIREDTSRFIESHAKSFKQTKQLNQSEKSYNKDVITEIVNIPSEDFMNDSEKAEGATFNDLFL